MSESEAEYESAYSAGEEFLDPHWTGELKVPRSPMPEEHFGLTPEDGYTSPIKVELAQAGAEKVVRFTVHPTYARVLAKLPNLDFDHVMAERLAEQIRKVVREARGFPHGGELTTELGCTIKVIPGAYDAPGKTALVLFMGQPGDGRRAEVLLSDAERAQLRAIL